jgi:hypothetical protein
MEKKARRQRKSEHSLRAHSNDESTKKLMNASHFKAVDIGAAASALMPGRTPFEMMVVSDVGVANADLQTHEAESAASPGRATSSSNVATQTVTAQTQVNNESLFGNGALANVNRWRASTAQISKEQVRICR